MTVICFRQSLRDILAQIDLHRLSARLSLNLFVVIEAVQHAGFQPDDLLLLDIRADDPVQVAAAVLKVLRGNAVDIVVFLVHEAEREQLRILARCNLIKAFFQEVGSVFENDVQLKLLGLLLAAFCVLRIFLLLLLLVCCKHLR